VTRPAWTVVIPVKPSARGKSRLSVEGVDRVALARAIALDTIVAAVACESVAQVVIVTDDGGLVLQAADIPGLRWNVIAKINTAEAFALYVAACAGAGADAIQLFDSWAGALSAAEYERFVLPHTRAVLAALAERHPGAPSIHFGVGCDHLLESIAAANPTVVGLDWRTSIGAARKRLGDGIAIQGNLDPALVLAGADVALAGTDAVLADNAGHPGHIFNLGHGVHPTSDPGVLAAIVDRVHEQTSTS
jgi:uroporphyrinogen decarboxylase